MACEFICDGCGKREPGSFYKTNPTRYFEPPNWYMRADDDGIQVACSRECLKKVAEKTGKTDVVLPI